MEIGTKVKILKDGYFAAGPDYPQDQESILNIAPGTEAEVVPLSEDAAFVIMFAPELAGAFTAFVEGMQEDDVLFLIPSEEGEYWERV